MKNFNEHINFIWAVADLLRGDYKQSEYGKVILPFTVLRRLDCVLEKTKEAVLAQVNKLPAKIDAKMKEMLLNKAAGANFHNVSKFTLQSLLSEPDNIKENLTHYIQSFNQDVNEVFIEHFDFEKQLEKLDRANLLYLVMQKFTAINLHPDKVTNMAMGYIFEELIRRFSEQSNETAGEHFTPREVIRLMVNLLFIEDKEILTTSSAIRTLYDPACGTGGMLSVAEDYLHELNSHAHLEVYGQELNGESYAICQSDMMLKGKNPKNIKYGNSFSQDGLPLQKFNYMLSNPPFGVEWKKVEKFIKNEANTQGYYGRFGAGLPRVSDGSLLFVQHMISKMSDDGSRIAVVLNGSPLFTGGAGSGESEIRRWIIENDWLEAIIALPSDLFYNTGIATYIWIMTNKKTAQRAGKIQLINASEFYTPMRKSLGKKRHEIAAEQIEQITKLFSDFAENTSSQIFDNADFGYQRVTVERPLRLNFCMERIDLVKATKGFKKFSKAEQEVFLKALGQIDSGKIFKNRDQFVKVLNKALKAESLKLSAAQLKWVLAALSEPDESADICKDKKGNPEPDPDLRDYENVPLKEDVQVYFEREVLPYVPEAWIDHSKTKVGYEIPFNRHFYEYVPPRSLAEIDADLDRVSAEIMALLKEVHV